jgi:hypothetical protein
MRKDILWLRNQKLNIDVFIPSLWVSDYNFFPYIKIIYVIKYGIGYCNQLSNNSCEICSSSFSE